MYQALPQPFCEVKGHARIVCARRGRAWERGYVLLCTWSAYVHESESRRTSPVSPGKMGTIFRGVVPSNTKKATSWAVRVFEEWRRERNAKATGEQCPLELLEKLTGCRSVTLPSPRHEQPKMSPYSPLQMVPIFPGETGEVNLRFAGDLLQGCSNATRNRTGRRDKTLSST